MTHPPTGNPAYVVTVSAAAYTGTFAHLVQIQASARRGQAEVRIEGLPTDAAWCTRDRLRAAFVNSGLSWPQQPTTLRVLPSSLPVGDSGLDLAFALALLAITGQLPPDAVAQIAAVGELGLDGSVRAVSAHAERAEVIADAGIPTVLVPAADPDTAAQRLGVRIRAAATLRELVTQLSSTPDSQPATAPDLVRAARATLTGLGMAGDNELHEIVSRFGPAEALTRFAYPDSPPSGTDEPAAGSLNAQAAAAIAWATRSGARVLIPGDDEWPTRLPDLLGVAPGQEHGAVCLWVRGNHPLSALLDRAVAMVGARAASAYGQHIAQQLGHDLAAAGWTVVTNGGYGIAATALHGALTAGGTPIAVLPASVNRPHPAGNTDLLTRVAETGLLVSPAPPDAMPTRDRFTSTGRMVATLAAGTVLVEAAHRSTALRVLEHAISLGRPAMVVPGPVTSFMSDGAHQALRTYRQTVLVRDAADVITELGRTGDAAT